MSWARFERDFDCELSDFLSQIEQFFESDFCANGVKKLIFTKRAKVLIIRMCTSGSTVIIFLTLQKRARFSKFICRDLSLVISERLSYKSGAGNIALLRSSAFQIIMQGG